MRTGTVALKAGH